MIKYYDTEAAFKADTGKGADESQVSLIKAGNICRYDGRNVVVGLRSARTGSVAYLDGSHALRFAAPGTFKADGLPEGGEVIGVVVIGVDHQDFRGEVAVMSRTFAVAPILERLFVRLSGYTLDGTDQTGTLSVREASDNWAAAHDYTVSYNADNAEALASQLNTYFRANEPFTAQDWVAEADGDGNVTLCYAYTSYHQTSNAAKDGFALANATAPEWAYTRRMLRRNGRRDGEGTITNWPRALAFFRGDNSSTTYNPASDVTTTKVSYPICLPGYLGTSRYQSDHCAFLRGVYGEGEEGWLKFMESFLPVRPSEYRIHNDSIYGTEKRNTYYLAGITYAGQDGVTKYASPAARLAADLGYDHELLRQGEWVLPDIDRVFSIVGQLKYPTTDGRDADPVNAALEAIGVSALGNSASVWSCSRCYPSIGWLANGNYGYAYANYLYYWYVAAPLVLLNAAGGAA
jgi:hypothetical protein|nr:MAG TPA: hypothetical protein [Caudoviricetes sp.]